MSILFWSAGIVFIFLVARKAYGYYGAPLCPTRFDSGYCLRCDKDEPTVRITVERNQ